MKCFVVCFENGLVDHPPKYVQFVNVGGKKIQILFDEVPSSTNCYFVMCDLRKVRD